MSAQIDSFYQELKTLKKNINKRTSKTIADEAFKDKTNGLFEQWKIELLPIAQQLGVSFPDYNEIEVLFRDIRDEADKRQSETSILQYRINRLVNAFFNNIVLAAKKAQPLEPTKNLMESAKFLGLDTNWSVATCALQLQEVSIKLVAEKMGINLTQSNVEKILCAKFETKDFGFNQQYEAFSIEIKRMTNVDMPFLATQFRRMRVKVLHEGHNPEPEEKDALVSFTIGLLKKLETICNKIA